MHVRRGSTSDFAEIESIQLSAEEAAQWDPSGYDLMVVESNGLIVGFMVWRIIAPDEAEILNLAVAPDFRRRGVASMLLRSLPASTCFLEVRESNFAARALYRKVGFVEAGIRVGYYSSPVESAIVLRLQS